MRDFVVVPTFRRGSYARGLHERNQKLTKGVNTTPGKVTWQVDAADGWTLRGLPAIGRAWAGGAIRGTRPGDGLFR